MRLARRLTFSLHAQRESKQRESAPDIRPEPVLRLFRVRSLHRRSGGTLRRALHGPAQLSRHPCRSTPSTPTPLTLLTGFTLAQTDLSTIQSRAGARSNSITAGALISPSAGRVEILRRGVRGRDAEQGTMGHGCPFVTTPGVIPERGKSQRSEDPYAGACFFCLLFFARAKKSKVPCKAQTVVMIEKSAAYWHRVKLVAGKSERPCQ